MLWPAVALGLVGTSRAAAQTPSVPAPPTAAPLTHATTTGALHGTLLVPAGDARVPVVFIHPGSGPTDRDGNTPLLPGKNNSLRLLAEGLAARGVASLRVDKRGIAASAKAAAAEEDLRLETYVADAVGWLDLLRRDRRFGPLVALGHSEGALICLLAAGRTEVDGYVSVAGIARKGSAVLRQQLRDRIPGPLLQENERILAALEQGQRTDTVPQALLALYRPSVQPYLISWFRYVPADELARLKVPVLIAQGTTDLQVDTMEAATLRSAQPNGKYLMVAGMNHVLKIVGGTLQDQMASYGDSTLPVAPALIDGVAEFAHRLPPRRTGRKVAQ